ncbi:MAG: response regulator [Elusimicrobia bacterium]|nr:response regulator [Elusimicrobiota bacterium]
MKSQNKTRDPGLATQDSSRVVLVVDDNQDQRNFLEMWLQEKGYRMEKAENAQKAKKYLSKKIPDLILLDLMMPDMNGVDLCRWICRQFSTRHVPVIVVSSISDEVTINDCLEMGAVNYVAKPINYPELLDKMNLALNRTEKRKKERG